MDEAAGRSDVGQPAPGDVDRIEALEQQVRQMTSRLAGWVEAQLVQSLDDRRSEMEALRGELQMFVDELLAGMRAEASSALTVATRRLEVAQEQLAERLDAVAERAADAAARTIALSTSSIAGERLEIVEQQVAQRLAVVQDQAKAELAAAGERQRAEIAALRREMAGLSGVAGMAEALEQRVRAAMSQLSDSVEGRFEEVAQARRSELDALRTELAALAEERAAQAASTSSSEVATTLGRRLDEMAGRVAAVAEEISGLKAEADAGPARIEAFEQRVKAAMVRLTESVETRLAETMAARDSDLDALRTELADRVEAARRQAGDGVAEAKLAVHAGGERTDLLERQTRSAVARVEELNTRLAELAAVREAEAERLRADIAAVAERVTELGVDAETTTTRTEELEQRVKAAVGRLAESVEGRLDELAAAQSDQVRTEVETAVTAMRSRFAQVHERVEAVEQRQRGAEEHLDAALEAKLGEVVERWRAELGAAKVDLEEALAEQLRGARAEIATAVAEAHRWSVVSADQLHVRMDVVADQSTAAHAAVAQIETLQETVRSDGRRLEALELHTRRTDARLGEVVDAKLSERAGRQGAELEGVRDELSAALDAHLAETRAQVTQALGDGRQELIDGAARLAERQATLDRESAKALADLDDLGASVAAALREAEDRLGATVQAKVAELEGVATRAAAYRDDIDASVATVARKVARMQDQLQKTVESAVAQMDSRAAAATKEAGTLAPLRSDVRLLQGQVAELAESVAEVRPRRKAPAAPAKKAPTVPAKKAQAAPAKRASAVPAKKVAAVPAKKAAAVPAKKVAVKKGAAVPVKKVAPRKAPAAGRTKRVQ